MKKRLVSLLLCGALLASALPGASAGFADISDENTAVAAAALQGMGIISGTSENTFEPQGTLTRAQACTMAVQAMGLSSQVSSYARKTLFSDVPSSAWYNGFVNLAYAQGVINGYGNGTFGPNDPVTYGQLATILLRMLGYTTAEIGSVWPLDYTAFAEDLGLADGLSLSPMEALTRGEAAVLLYNTLKTAVKGSGQPYYKTISGVSSTSEAILLDTAATYGGNSGLLMVYSLDGSGGVEYYTQIRTQSDILTGSLGALLFDGTGRVTGFVPESDGCKDLTIGSATAAALTDANGTSYRISADAVVLSGGESYPYRTSGYLQLDNQAGKNVRLYYDDSGAIAYLCLTGGTSAASEAAVAASSSASFLARALGISNQNYAITKNGSTAGEDALAQYDVGYYDGASSALRASDYRITGYLSDASPNLTAPSTLTLSGCTLEVLECAWDTLGQFDPGDKVTLLLTDDGKVAAACAPSTVTADMVGVLNTNGRSVTLVGSGLTLSASEMNYDKDCLGGLVTVTAIGLDELKCSALAAGSGKVDLTEGTLGGRRLAPSCAIYEWAGSGCVYDLEGNLGAASSDFTAIGWTDSLAAAHVDSYHVNSAGQVDVILLDDVTGNLYDYGELTRYTGREGISLGSGSTGYNAAATLTNSAGTTSKYLCAYTPSGSSDYAGIALGQSSSGTTKVSALQNLSKLTKVAASAFYQADGKWYAEVNGTEYPVSGNLEVHLTDTDRWLGGEDGLTRVLADGYELTLYYDRAPNQGGQIRLIAAKQG